MPVQSGHHGKVISLTPLKKSNAVLLGIYITTIASIPVSQPVKKKIVPLKNFILGQKFSAIVLKFFVLP